MDTFELRGEQIELPLVGRALCIQALKLVNELMPPEPTISDESLEAQLQIFLQTAAELQQKNAQPFSFDSFNITSYPIDKILNGSILESITSNLANQDALIQLAHDTADEDEIESLCYAMMVSIGVAQEMESNLCEMEGITYRQLTTAMDGYLLAISNLYTLLSRIKADLEIVSHKIKRKVVAQRGGMATANRLRELKDSVLAEAAGKYNDLPATTAAKFIFEHISSKPQYLSDEHYKPLLTDPQASFLRWIRDDRKRSRPKKL